MQMEAEALVLRRPPGLTDALCLVKPCLCVYYGSSGKILFAEMLALSMSCSLNLVWFLCNHYVFLIQVFEVKKI